MIWRVELLSVKKWVATVLVGSPEELLADEISGTLLVLECTGWFESIRTRLRTHAVGSGRT